MTEPRLQQDSEEQGQGNLLEIVRRRRWYILGPFFTIGLIGFSVAQVIPVEYRSEAFIIVDQQKVPEQYVTPNVLLNLQRRLDAMTQQILSRTRLQRLIQDFGLYSQDLKRKSMDDMIDTMRKKIKIELVQTPGRKEDLTGFRIHFNSPEPQTAQRVAGELTSLFIEQNVRDRTQQSMGTTAFLESELEQARKELAEVEERVRQYKLQHLGQLPEQQQSNLQILSSLQAQLHANTSVQDRAGQQRIYLESMRAQMESARNIQKSSDEPGTGNPSPATSSLPMAESTVAELWKQLKDVNAKFTDRHPDVLRLKKEIAEWENAIQRLRSERMPLAEIDSKLKAVNSEIENAKRESDDLRTRIREVQNRLNMTPVREQELAGVTRQYESARTQYQSLLQKKMGSELASNLEQRQGGEQFRLLDPAGLPKRPEPGRLKVILIGWALGAGLGLALTVLKEFTDHSIHQVSHLEAFPRLEILANIPNLATSQDLLRQRRLRRVEVVVMVLATIAALGSAAHTFLNNTRA